MGADSDIAQFGQVQCYSARSDGVLPRHRPQIRKSAGCAKDDTKRHSSTIVGGYLTIFPFPFLFAWVC